MERVVKRVRVGAARVTEPLPTTDGAIKVMQCDMACVPFGQCQYRRGRASAGAGP